MSDLVLTTMPAPRAGRRLVMRAAMVLAMVCSLAPQVGAAQAKGELPDFTELVEKVGPSVVNIRTLERGGRGSAGPGGGVDPEALDLAQGGIDGLERDTAKHGLALAGDLAFHHRLRGDTGVIRPGHPHRVVRAHAAPTDQDVL